jgi:hypothetical protein
MGAGCHPFFQNVLLDHERSSIQKCQERKQTSSPQDFIRRGGHEDDKLMVFCYSETKHNLFSHCNSKADASYWGRRAVV